MKGKGANNIVLHMKSN